MKVFLPNFTAQHKVFSLEGTRLTKILFIYVSRLLITLLSSFLLYCALYADSKLILSIFLVNFICHGSDTIPGFFDSRPDFIGRKHETVSPSVPKLESVTVLHAGLGIGPVD